MSYVLHCFIPGQTIDAVIKLKGRHNYTQDEMKVLRLAFKALNGDVNPRAGSTMKIPLPIVLDAVDDEGAID